MKEIRPEFEILIDKIVKQEFMDTNSIYQFEKTELLDQYFTDQNNSNSPEIGVNKFSGVGEIINYISTIAGTFATVLKLIDWFKEKNRNNEKALDKVSELWKEKLVNEGLTENKANEICTQYKEDLLKIIKNKKS